MMMTLYNSISNLNDFADETTYRLNGKVEMNGPRNIGLATMQATGDMPVPAPMALALWLGDKFNRLYLNNVNTPDVKGVNMSLDLLPERRVAAIETGWVANHRSAGGRRPGGEGFGASVSRRADSARGNGEDSRRTGQRRSPHPAERRGYAESHAERGGLL